MIKLYANTVEDVEIPAKYHLAAISTPTETSELVCVVVDKQERLETYMEVGLCLQLVTFAALIVLFFGKRRAERRKRT